MPSSEATEHTDEPQRGGIRRVLRGRVGYSPLSFHSISCVRFAAVLCATLLMVGVLAVLVLIVADSIQSFHEQFWDTFSKQFDTVMRQIVAWIKANVHVDASALLKVFETLAKELSSASTLMSIANAIITIVVTLLLMMFLLLDRRFDFNSDAQAGAPTEANRSGLHLTASLTHPMWITIDEAIHRYISAKTIVSACMGLLVYVVLGPILHVKLAHLFGVVTFILNFIPNVVSTGHLGSDY